MADRIMQVVEHQAALFGGHDLTVRWRWETGEVGKDVYHDLSDQELEDVLSEIGVLTSPGR